MAENQSRTDAIARNVAAQTRMRELALAERMGVLVQATDGREIVHASIAAFKNLLGMLSGDVCDQLAAVTGLDARFFRQHLRAFQRRAQQHFVDDMAAHWERENGRPPPWRARDGE